MHTPEASPGSSSASGGASKPTSGGPHDGDSALSTARYDTLAYRDAAVRGPETSDSGKGRFDIKAHVGRRVFRRLLYGRHAAAAAPWPLLRAHSCFGGLAIYNASRLAARGGACGYEAAEPSAPDCEHANLHACLRREAAGFALYLHPQLHMPAPIITQPGGAPLSEHDELPSELPHDLRPEGVRASAVRFFGFVGRVMLDDGNRPLRDPPQALLLGCELLRAARLSGTSGGTADGGAWAVDGAAEREATQLAPSTGEKPARRMARGWLGPPRGRGLALVHLGGGRSYLARGGRTPPRDVPCCSSCRSHRPLRHLARHAMPRTFVGRPFPTDASSPRLGGQQAAAMWATARARTSSPLSRWAGRCARRRSA